MSRLDEIKARADAATEGPWVRDMHSPDMSGRSGWYIRGPRKLGLRSMVLNSRMLSGDAEFIDNAREDVPWLLTLVESLTAERDAMWAGTDPTPVEPGVTATDAQSLHHMLGQSPENRLNNFALMRHYAVVGADCAARGDEWEIAKLRAERDALAAQVARVEKLAEDWRYKGQFGWGAWQIGEGPDPEGYVMDHCASAIRAALSGSGADTTDTQTTDQEVSDE